MRYEKTLKDFKGPIFWDIQRILRRRITPILVGKYIHHPRLQMSLSQNGRQEFQVPKLEVLNLIRLFLGWVSLT